MIISGKTVREIHKKIYSMTIKTPKMYLFMEKVSNRASKVVNKRKTADENAVLLLLLFSKMDYNGKIKALINHEVMEEAEKQKQAVVKSYINDSRSSDKWLYLASSHSDCAKDHLPYQGKLYYDEKAPEDIVRYAKRKGLHSIQWVMGKPAWFITRPNCRHFFRALDTDKVKKYSVKELTRRYKTHRIAGDTRLSTPAKVAVEEYTDRLRMLRAMYQEHQTEILRRQIQKTELLLKKWKKIL